MNDFYRPMKDLSCNIQRMEKMYHPVEKGIRLYCTQSGSAWTLQIRSPIGTGFAGYGPAKVSAIGHASLSKGDMIALRDAINAELDSMSNNVQAA